MGSGMSESKDCDFSRRGKKTSKGTCVLTIQSTLLRSISRRYYTLSEHSLPDVASPLARHSFPEFRRREFQTTGRSQEDEKKRRSGTPPLQYSVLPLLLSFVTPSLHFFRFKARHDH
jgi:hypothetical protein